jgi:hypothetical protein
MLLTQDLLEKTPTKAAIISFGVLLTHRLWVKTPHNGIKSPLKNYK